MREIIILAGGRGSKMFPFDKVGSKTMRPLGNRPLLVRMVDTLRSFTGDPVHIVTLEEFAGTIAAAFADYGAVFVHPLQETNGSAETLLAGLGHIESETFLVLHGDTLVDGESLRTLWNAAAPSVLVYPVQGSPSDWICCIPEDGRLKEIGAHHRGSAMTHQMAGFVLPRSFRTALLYTPEYFPGMKAGEGAPRERYLEAALSLYLAKNPVAALPGRGLFFDIDKPWHLGEANRALVEQECAGLGTAELGEGSSIDAAADIRGSVRLGRNSRIGKGVSVRGSLAVGDNTLIDNGAVIAGNVLLGSNTRVTDYAKIHGGSSVGNHCVVDHCAEFLGGILMDRVYLSHYGEIYGVVGTCVDFGAGTVCGTLRFDDGLPDIRINGRRERPGSFGCGSFVGDYSRTGVGTMLMPGCRIGAYCAVGPGLIVQGDYAHNTITRLVQQVEQKTWGPERYGW
ncbi:MAG: NTP transferase domain-containing protein [Treponema sp.]|jgi:bifunctional UDP-N-acetylglucosamine pyrophosphorylase/glucosamine-1-phosphate N-acetyltransferase|nr:NTP transferase domain-containing protein [Treponema sp.]